MGADIGSDGDAGVAEEVTDDFEWDALGEEEGGGAVAEFVGVLVVEVGGFGGSAKGVADVGAVEWCAESGAEDEVCTEWQFGPFAAVTCRSTIPTVKELSAGGGIRHACCVASVRPRSTFRLARLSPPRTFPA